MMHLLVKNLYKSLKNILKLKDCFEGIALYSYTLTIYQSFSFFRQLKIIHLYLVVSSVDSWVFQLLNLPFFCVILMPFRDDDFFIHQSWFTKAK